MNPMLKDEIKKIDKKEQKNKSTRANLLNLWPNSWDHDNFIKNKYKNYEDTFPLNPMLKVEIKKKKKRRRLCCWKVKLRNKSIKNDKKKNRVNPLNLWLGSWGRDNPVEKK